MSLLTKAVAVFHRLYPKYPVGFICLIDVVCWHHLKKKKSNSNAGLELFLFVDGHFILILMF